MLKLTQRLNVSQLNTDEALTPHCTLELSAEDRQRSRYRFQLATGEEIILDLPRGTLLQEGDLLQAETGELVQIVAKSEPVLTIQAQSSLDLLKAAYHLGNRHVPLEITETHLRLTPNPVLQHLLLQLGLTVIEEIAPFSPESGAYGHSHG